MYKLLVYLCNIVKYGLFYLETKYFSDFIDKNELTVLSNKIKKNKKIVIYGFGPYGEEYFITYFSYSRIVDIYDMNYKKLGKHIKNPDNINNCTFDYIIITVMETNSRKKIVDFLIKKNIPLEKMVFVNYLTS